MTHKEGRKLLLRDWLEVQLDSGRAQGIEWVQKEVGIFKMVWRHANNPIWNEEDGWIYREWAIHKDHYKRNADGTWPDADYPTWKARFRCALKRCNDIEEVKVQKSPGQGKLEWKLYKLFPKKDRRSAPVFTFPTTVVSQPTDSAFGSTNQTINQTMCIPTTGTCSTDVLHTVVFATQQDKERLPATLPAVLAGYQGTPPTSMQMEETRQEEKISGGLLDLSPLELFQLSSETFKEYGQALMDVSMGNSIEIDNTGAVIEMPDSVSYMSFKRAPEDHDMCLWLRYRNIVVGKHYIQNPNGCRIYNADQLNIPQLSDQFTGTSHVGFPSPQFHYKGKIDPLNLDNTEKLLAYMDNGLHIYCDNDRNIYATRLSRCRIYYADPAMNAAEPLLLPRKQKVKVFDSFKFNQGFQELQRRGGKGERPSVSVLFSFGEQWSLTKAIDKTLISATIINAQCWYQLRAFMYKAHAGGNATINMKSEDDIKDLSSEYQRMSLEEQGQGQGPIEAGAMG